MRRSMVFFAVGAAIMGLWLIALWPMLTRTGPSPGAGAQYVFALIPSLAAAACLFVVAAFLAARDRSTRAWQRVTVTAISAVGAVALTAVLVRMLSGTAG